MIPMDAFEEVIAAVTGRLQPLGFSRQRMALRRIIDGSAVVFEFQKSDKSSNAQIIFTLNLGLVRGELIDSGASALQKAMFQDSHLSVRLGRLLDQPSDKWWELSETTDPHSLAAELSDILLTRAVPYFDKYQSADALIALWESGKSPGLTAVQRARYLHKLKNRTPV